MYLMLRNIKLLSRPGNLVGHPSCIVKYSQLLDDVSKCLSQREPLSVGLAFGLQLMVESYKSFLWPVNNFLQGSDKCRVRALRLARELKKVLDVVMKVKPRVASSFCGPGCRSVQLDTTLEAFDEDVSAFINQSGFDIYHQAPWVAGKHILTLQTKAMRVGSKLCHQMHVLGMTLHLYNALQQIGIIPEENILLEQLCVVLSAQVFQQVRPGRKFYTRFLQFLGGRLTFTRNRGDQYGEDHGPVLASERKSPCQSWKVIAAPKTRTQYYNNRSLLTNTSTAISLYLFGFEPPNNYTAQTWSCAIFGTSLPGNYAHRDIEKIKDGIANDKFGNVMDKVFKNVESEFETPFTLTKLNWLRVYVTCVNILDGITIRKLAEPNSLVDLAYPDTMQRLAQTRELVEKFLRDADRQCGTLDGMKSFLDDHEKELDTAERHFKMRSKVCYSTWLNLFEDWSNKRV